MGRPVVWARVRAVAIMLAAFTVAALSIADVWSEDVSGLVIGSMGVAWFGHELRSAQSRGDRRLLLVGVVSAGLMVLASVVELL